MSDQLPGDFVDKNPVGIELLNKILANWFQLENPLHYLNEVLQYWGVVYPIQTYDSASTSESDSIPVFSDLCELPICALEMLYEHEFDNYEFIPDKSLLQSTLLKNKSRSILIMVEKQNDENGRFFDICTYFPDEYIHSLNLSFRYFESVVESGDVTEKEFFARMQPVGFTEEWLHTTNFDPFVGEDDLSDCWSGFHHLMDVAPNGHWLPPENCANPIDLNSEYSGLVGASDSDENENIALFNLLKIPESDRESFKTSTGIFGCRKQRRECICPSHKLVSENSHWQQNNKCYFPIASLYSDNAVNCLEGETNHRRGQIATVFPSPADYDNYAELQCGWNEMENSFAIQSNGQKIIKSINDWSVWPSKSFSDVPSLFETRSCEKYELEYDCDPSETTVDSAACMTSHPYCSKAHLKHWGRIQSDSSVYLNAAKYQNEPWIGNLLQTPKTIETKLGSDSRSRTLDATNAQLDTSKSLIPVIKGATTERPIYGATSTSIIDVSDQLRILHVSYISNTIRLMQNKQGASDLSISNLSLVDERQIDCFVPDDSSDSMPIDKAIYTGSSFHLKVKGERHNGKFIVYRNVDNEGGWNVSDVSDAQGTIFEIHELYYGEVSSGRFGLKFKSESESKWLTFFTAAGGNLHEGFNYEWFDGAQFFNSKLGDTPTNDSIAIGYHVTLCDETALSDFRNAFFQFDFEQTASVSLETFFIQHVPQTASYPPKIVLAGDTMYSANLSFFTNLNGTYNYLDLEVKQGSNLEFEFI